MKFVYCGYDFAIDALIRLLDQGHELTAILSFPCDNVFSFNQRVQALAHDLSVPFIEEKPDQALMDKLIENGTELFLSMGYLYKLPPIDESKAYGVNVHPALLPKCRGLMPLPSVIMNAPEAAGVTIHKLAAEIDAGDILLQKPLPLSGQETVEALAARIALALQPMVTQLVNDLPDLWAKAQPQKERAATHAPTPDDAMRRIDWDASVESILCQARAFGGMGVLFNLRGGLWVASALSGWVEPHTHSPGDLIHLTARDVVFAAKDGYVCISEADQVLTA